MKSSIKNPFPAPTVRNPIVLPDGTAHAGTVFLKAAIDHPQFDVGDYTYASAHTVPDDWAACLAPYLYPHGPERLSIGRFCQIASGVQFITSSANHRYDGFSTYPFAVMDGDFGRDRASMPVGGRDTVVGNDVWIGTGAIILPGSVIGHGAIIGAAAVVAGTVPDYAIVVGNPAQVARLRFDAKTITALVDLAWWDWPIDHIQAHEAAICGADIHALRRATPT